MLVHVNGKRIAEIRKAKKITQAELAACAGISTRTLSAYESGDIQSCRVETLEKISDKLDVFINDIMIEGTFNSNAAILRMLFSSAEQQGVYLSIEFKRALLCTEDISMKGRVACILDHLFYEAENKQFSNTEFFYEYKRDIYHIIGDYFVSCRASNFTNAEFSIETYWTKIMRLLSDIEPVISNDLLEEFRKCRIKSNEERRNLLVYVYHLLLEKYDNKNFATEVQEDLKNNLEKKVHHLFVLICNLLDDSEIVDKTWANNFCLESGMALRRYISVKIDESILESNEEEDEPVKERYIEDRIEKFIRLLDDGYRECGKEPDLYWYRGTIEYTM